MDLIVNVREVPIVRRDKRIGQDGYGSNSSTIGSGSTPSYTPASEPLEVPFISMDYPSLTDYQTTYSDAYGQYPTVWLFVTGATKPTDVVPNRNKVSGLLDSIVFDMGESVSGVIIIKR